MKVLIVFNHPAPYKVSIFNEVAKHCDLTVIFERKKAGDRPEAFYSNNEYNFNVIFLNKGYFGKEGTISYKVRDYIKDHHKEFDHIVMNGYSHVSEMRAIDYMKKHGIKYSLLINGGLARTHECFIRRCIKKHYISSASFFMSPSEKSDEYLIHYGASKENIHRYPYSNLSEKELKAPKGDKVELRKKLSLPLDTPIFVNASQFIKRKNNLQLISLFKEREDYLLLIGEGKENKKYQKFISKHDIKNVIIRPFVKKEELFKYYQASDAFVSLAKRDIFGHTILEALANKLPVVASNNIVSALEYVKDGYNGYIVSLDNDNHINEAMNKALKLDQEKCLESIKENTFENCGKAIIEILQKEGE